MTSKERADARYYRRRLKRLNKKLEKQVSFKEAMSFNNLYLAGKECCKGCRWKTSTIRFEANMYSEVYKLYTNLNHGKYKFSNFQTFTTIERGKTRNIDALHIKDRTVQKCICQHVLIPLYTRTFIYDNGASQKDKGISFALNRCKQHLVRHYRKFGLEGGIYLFDIKNYFGSLPHDKLKQNVIDKIKDKDLQKLVFQMIDDFQKLSINKELPVKTQGVGLGSEVSQLLAIDYLSPIDHLIKDKFGIKGYGRYNDDTYVISESLEKLKQIKAEVESLVSKLGLKINPKKNLIIPLKNHNFTFLKVRMRFTETGKIIQKINRKSVKTMNSKLNKFRKFLNNKKLSFIDVYQSYQSWRTYALQFNAYKTVQSLDKKFKFLFQNELTKNKFNKLCTIKGV